MDSKAQWRQAQDSSDESRQLIERGRQLHNEAVFRAFLTVAGVLIAPVLKYGRFFREHKNGHTSLPLGQKTL